MRYIALFETDKEADNVGVVFPDLPGCFSAGKDYDDAMRNAHVAVALYLEDKRDLPVARSLEQIKLEWEEWKTWEDNYSFVVGLVSAFPVSKPKKYTVYMDSSLMAKIDAVTKNRSEFLTIAAERMLNGT
ncbi:MAG: type II toxin-antitoxin system HicB family antitoxin [Proteobacteria bacterium]|nr:type II toxin-antitoxin system HicB family antitoxin [Pseudomonadota bacterium]